MNDDPRLSIRLEILAQKDEYDRDKHMTPPAMPATARHMKPSKCERPDSLPLPVRRESVWVADNLSPLHEILFVSVVCLAQICTLAALGAVLNILPLIGANYGITTTAQLSWLFAGFSLTEGTFMLFSGRLGDVFGYKKVLIFGYLWFSLWTMAAGFTVYLQFPVHVFTRIMQGIGPAIIVPNTVAIVGTVYPPGHRKEVVFSIFGAIGLTGFVLGMLSSALFSLLWWPWTYWSSAIAIAFIAVAVHHIVPVPPTQVCSAHAGRSTGRLADLDLLGALTGIGALMFINFACNQAPIFGWSHPATVWTLVLGLIILGLFFYIELKIASHPLLPFDLLSGDVIFVLAVTAFGWGGFGIWLYYAFLDLQQVHSLNPMVSTLWVLPVAFAGGIATITTIFLLGPVKLSPAGLLATSMAAFTLGILLDATCPVDQSYWGQTFACLLIIPFGMDMSATAASIIISNAATKEQQGMAGSLVSIVLNNAMSLGLGFAGTLVVNISSADTTQNPNLLIGLRGAFYMAVGLAAVGLLLSLAFLLWTRRSPRKVTCCECQREMASTTNTKVSQETFDLHPEPSAIV